MTAKDLIGEKFGRWTVVGAPVVKNKHHYYWLCRCDCGKEKYVYYYNLISGKSKSCGCYQKDFPSFKTHGDKNTRLYGVWSAMKRRCNNSHVKAFHRYGGRGIKVCKEWNDFVVFKKWAISSGYTDKLTIERINNNGNYEPSNCTWIPRSQQAKNRISSKIITIDGMNKCFSDWCKYFGVNISTAYGRMSRNKDPFC